MGEFARKRDLLKNCTSELKFMESSQTDAGVVEVIVPPQRTDEVIRSCCFSIDKRCLFFGVQTFIGVGLLVFCAFRLAFETSCDRASPYWGLVGSIVGFFFQQATHRKK